MFSLHRPVCPSGIRRRYSSRFRQVRIEVAELVADALDCRADVSSIAVIAASCDEAVVHTVVDRAIGHPATDVRYQEMDDFVLSLGEAHIGVVSVTPAHIAINDEQIMRSAEAGEVADLAVSSKRLMLDQNLHATCLVDEVDGASIAREAFARDIGKTPVENDDVLERGD